MPPRGLGWPARPLSPFLDERDFTGVDCFRSVERHLERSRKLVVICSPAARASPYVNDEIRRFVAARGVEHVVPLLLEGAARFGQYSRIASSKYQVRRISITSYSRDRAGGNAR